MDQQFLRKRPDQNPQQNFKYNNRYMHSDLQFGEEVEMHRGLFQPISQLATSHPLA